MLCTYDRQIVIHHHNRKDVKPASSDGTWTQSGPGRVARRQDSDVLPKDLTNASVFLFSDTLTSNAVFDRQAETRPTAAGSLLGCSYAPLVGGDDIRRHHVRDSVYLLGQ